MSHPETKPFWLSDAIYLKPDDRISPSFLSKSTIASSVGGPSSNFSVSLLLHALSTHVNERCKDLNRSGSAVISASDRMALFELLFNRTWVGRLQLRSWDCNRDALEMRSMQLFRQRDWGSLMVGLIGYSANWFSNVYAILIHCFLFEN